MPNKLTLIKSAFYCRIYIRVSQDIHWKLRNPFSSAYYIKHQADAYSLLVVAVVVVWGPESGCTAACRLMV
jgi:hypothetical protein